MIMRQKLFLKKDGGKVAVTDSEKNAGAVVVCLKDNRPALEKMLLSVFNTQNRITIYFEDMDEVLKKDKHLFAGYGDGSGKNNAMDAARGALFSLIKSGGRADETSEFLFLHFACSKDITFYAMVTAMDFLKERLSADTKIFFGQSYDVEGVDRVKCVMLTSAAGRAKN